MKYFLIYIYSIILALRHSILTNLRNVFRNARDHLTEKYIQYLFPDYIIIHIAKKNKNFLSKMQHCDLWITIGSVEIYLQNCGYKIFGNAFYKNKISHLISHDANMFVEYTCVAT